MLEKREKTIEIFKNYQDNQRKRTQKVQTKEYLNWLVDFTNENKHWDDEWILYNKDISKEDRENGGLLSYFQYYVESEANKQFIINSDDYYQCDYDIKLLGNYYNIRTIVGQGAITSIRKLEEIPEIYVFMDEEPSAEILKERELIEYIIINKDLKNVSSAKIAVHIGHACTIATFEEKDTEKFRKWYSNKYNQKKIILEAPQKRLEELEKNFYAVRDNGLTEVEKNTLIAVSLGIMSRKEAAPYIKRLQTWKGQ